MEPSESSSRRHRIGGVSKNQMAGLYDLEDTIGEGHYAVVKLARHVFTGERVAVKVIDKMKLDSATRLQMLQEVRLMKLVQHPYVVRLYEVIDTHTKLYLVLEFADGGDMYDYIMRHEGGLEEATAKKYFRQIVTAIQYCHKLHVVHRDLKPENVVFFEKLGMVKLTDFGFSNKFDPGQRLQTSCGSLAYSAPEILLGDAYDAPAVDIWSLGVILYMLVCGTAPFQEANDSETLTMIMDCKYSFPSHISQQCKSLISRMLQRQPEVRASLEDIVHDPWLEEGEETVDGQVVKGIPEDARIPLVSREHLTDEEHSSVLQRMVNGAIAHRDDIIAALDRNEYNHITATYFLLAERKLRSQKSDQSKRHRALAIAQKTELSASSAPSMSAVSKKQQSGEDASILAPQSSILAAPQRLLASKRFQPQSATPMADTLFASQQDPGLRARKCTIVEEEESEEDDSVGGQLTKTTQDDSELLQRGLSRHSSTSSLSEKTVPTPSSVLSTSCSTILDTHPETVVDRPLLAAIGESVSMDTPPAPFPMSSQIQTGGLSRQGSLRRSGGETSGSSPASERKSIPGSPSTPPGSNTPSSHGSPARYKLAMQPTRKLVTTRSSPQLVQTAPLLNQIHEEAEEGSPSPSSSSSTMQQVIDPVDQFPATPAGAAVIRRLEQRRRLRLHKSRTQSCSSSDASDDDESKKNQQQGHEKTPTPPPVGRDPHDDSSDNQDPGVGGGGSGCGASGSSDATSQKQQQKASGNQQEGQQQQQQTKTAATTSRRSQRQPVNRVRQSRSLNRISELHVADFSSTEEKSSNVVVVPPPTSSSDDCDMMLCRYLESVNNLRPQQRSRDDSLNSSDGEVDLVNMNKPPPRRHKVNLRVLEQRLNKIQEECNNFHNSNGSSNKSEEDESAQGIIEIKAMLDRRNENNSLDETTSVKSCEVIGARKKPLLHRAHSCGSLFSLKERALLRTRLTSVPVAFWDFWEEQQNGHNNKNGGQNLKRPPDALALTLAAAATAAASNPLTVLQLQGTSRCCSLC